MNIPEDIRNFLSSSGWGDARIDPIPGDASFRRYFRVIDGDQQAILMDAPPPHEDPKPFVDMAEHLVGQGFRAPQIIERNMQRGLILIEDFGDCRMREFLDANPGEEMAVYERAVQLLVDLHHEETAALAPYNMAAYLRETGLLTEWYCPDRGLAVDQEAYDGLWRDALKAVETAAQPPVTVLRDYHAENIMLLEGGQLGLLDFQDALAGHRAYDLVSLLQDARRDVTPAVEQAMIAQYLAANSQLDAERFRAEYAILGAQRNSKIIGIFTRLARRDGKLRYLDFLPRMWGLLERDLDHPALAPLTEWFDANIPSELRENRGSLEEFAGG